MDGKEGLWVESARFGETARVGFIGEGYEVYIMTDDSHNVPHVHVRDVRTKGSDFETCIELCANRYCLHGAYRGAMDINQRTCFAEFMESPCRNKRYATNYEYAVEMWNDNNASATVLLENNPAIQIVIPDYRTIL